jgi:hypothetical protein
METDNMNDDARDPSASRGSFDAARARRDDFDGMVAAARDFAARYQKFYGRLPIIMHAEIYRSMDDLVEIVESRDCAARDASVVVSCRFGSRAKAELNELQIR